MVDVEMRKMRDEVVSHEEAHEDPVIYYSLQVIFWTNVILKNQIIQNIKKKKVNSKIIRNTVNW